MKQTTNSLKIYLISSLLLLMMVAGKSTIACNATFTHTNACAGDTVWFSAFDQSAIYTWDFGDSSLVVNIGHDTTAFHVYNTPGTYYVTLFVNIGAEWDYQTQIITVGTDCFHADFVGKCAGLNEIDFTNNSIGSGSLSWDFGDPASGTSNTSSVANPYHVYPATGNYTVRLIINNGTAADTTYHLITVPVNCIDATIVYNINGNCLNDSTAMTLFYTGTVPSHIWDFGDPASGVSNTSTLANPKHLYSALGSYTVRLIYSDGVTTDTTYAVQTIIDCTVWPGDCNRDGEVNADDIFPLGMFYGASGTVRPAATTAFTSQPCTDWPSFSSYMYLQDYVNEKHADADGDGTIGSSDLSDITLNYGMKHNTHNNVSAMPEATAADPDMSISFPVGTANGGDYVTAIIDLGSAAKPIMNLYGYSFTVNYDPSMVMPGTLSVDLSSSWLGSITNELTLTHNDYAHGKVDASAVRYDKTQIINGYGQIATITFQLKPTASGTLNLSLASTAKALSTQMYGGSSSGNTEIFRPINLTGDNLTVTTTGVNERVIDNTISIYPNPATNFVNVTINNTEVLEFDLTNELGQVVYSAAGHFTNTIQISTSELAKGIYSLSCRTKDGLTVKKISIIK